MENNSLCMTSLAFASCFCVHSHMEKESAIGIFVHVAEYKLSLALLCSLLGFWSCLQVYMSFFCISHCKLQTSFSVFEVVSLMDVTHSSLSPGDRTPSAHKFLSAVYRSHPYFSEIFSYPKTW